MDIMSNTNQERRENLILVPLHKYPEFREECKSILNHEWPKSDAFRYRSFDSSNDNLPTNLVFIDKKCEKVKVIGHSRLNYVPKNSETVWVESVIIHHECRGKGYGSILMKRTEEYAKLLGFTCTALSTLGQEDFYLKLGYKFIKPISLYGGRANSIPFPNKIMPVCEANAAFKHQESCINCIKETSNDDKNSLPSNNENCNSYNYKNCTSSNRKNSHNCNNYNSISISPPPKPPLYTNSTSAFNVPPPPPPPPPPLPSTQIRKLEKSDIQRIDGKITKLYMRKEISLTNECCL